MSDPHPARPLRSGERPASPAAERRTLFRKLVEFVSPGPDSRDELISTLADAEHRELIAPESRLMLEGVLRMADVADALLGITDDRANRTRHTTLRSAYQQLRPQGKKNVEEAVAGIARLIDKHARTV